MSMAVSMCSTIGASTQSQFRVCMTICASCFDGGHPAQWVWIPACRIAASLITITTCCSLRSDRLLNPFIGRLWVEALLLGEGIAGSTKLVQFLTTWSQLESLLMLRMATASGASTYQASSMQVSFSDLRNIVGRMNALLVF